MVSGALPPSQSDSLAECEDSWPAELVISPEPLIACGIMQRLVRVVLIAIAATCVCLVGVAEGSPWRLQTSPRLTGKGAATLAGVACATRAFCIAFGSRATGRNVVKYGLSDPVIESLEHGVWTIDATPQIPVPDSQLGIQRLSAASCPQANDCVVVGQWGGVHGGRDYESSMSYIWNGSVWKPNFMAPGFISRNFSPYAVSCSNADRCLAVGTGYSKSPDAAAAGVAEAWNGRAWRVVAAPPQDVGDGVACLPTGACFATEQDWGAGLARWSGHRWSRVFTFAKSYMMDAVTCHGARFCMAVGERSIGDGSASTPAATVWNGVHWRVVSAPGPSSSKLSAKLTNVHCLSARYCVATGISEPWDSASNAVWGLTDTWNGTRWIANGKPDPHYVPQGLECVTRGDCLSAGDEWPGGHPRIGKLR